MGKKDIFLCEAVACPVCYEEEGADPARIGYRALCGEHEVEMAKREGLCTRCICKPCACDRMQFYTIPQEMLT